MRRWLLALFGALPLVALAAHQVDPHGPVVRVLDAWFSFHCHQDPARTLRFLGQGLPVCARCTGIYSGVLLGALVRRRAMSRGGWLVMLGAGILLLVLDVGSQAAGFRVSSNTLRFFSGVLLSFPAARLALADTDPARDTKDPVAPSPAPR